jgi:hypothetical protein
MLRRRELLVGYKNESLSQGAACKTDINSFETSGIRSNKEGVIKLMEVPRNYSCFL